jgi:hypothetical protein
MMLGIEHQLLIISRIKELNNIKDYDKRLAEIIAFKDASLSAHISELRDDYDDLFSIADLTRTKEGKEVSIIKKVTQLSIAFDEEQQEQIDYELLCENVTEAVEGLYWYDKEILMLYIELGNYRAIERKTGIPYASAYKTVQKVIKEIKQKIK